MIYLAYAFILIKYTAVEAMRYGMLYSQYLAGNSLPHRTVQHHTQRPCVRVFVPIFFHHCKFTNFFAFFPRFIIFADENTHSRPPGTTLNTMSITKANEVFDRSVADYHKTDNVDAPCVNPYTEGSFEHILYGKNWVDAVQWHLEDIIRDPEIDPVEALALKRRIDRSNQVRTDMVEDIDSWYRDKYKDVQVREGATINTESPAWALDRLSILALKIWHMREQTERKDADPEHLVRCKAKLDVLLEQRHDLSTAIDQLIDDIAAGRKFMKVYRQMKMYNDPATNPVLYGKKA